MPGATSLDHEYEYAVAHDVFGLDERALARIARAALDASYAPADVRDRISAELDAYVREQVPTG